MRTLTLHTADELVERWRARAERRRTVWGDPDGAHQIECCATELAAILAASMEMEAAHHGDPEPLSLTSPPGTGWTGRPGDCRVCGVGLPQHHFQCPVPEADPNALREWLAGERP